MTKKIKAQKKLLKMIKTAENQRSLSENGRSVIIGLKIENKYQWFSLLNKGFYPKSELLNVTEIAQCMVAELTDHTGVSPIHQIR